MVILKEYNDIIRFPAVLPMAHLLTVIMCQCHIRRNILICRSDKRCHRARKTSYDVYTKFRTAVNSPDF